jgi:hypothetical protein
LPRPAACAPVTSTRPSTRHDADHFLRAPFGGLFNATRRRRDDPTRWRRATGKTHGRQTPPGAAPAGSAARSRIIHLIPRPVADALARARSPARAAPLQGRPGDAHEDDIESSSNYSPGAGRARLSWSGRRAARRNAELSKKRPSSASPAERMIRPRASSRRAGGASQAASQPIGLAVPFAGPPRPLFCLSGRGANPNPRCDEVPTYLFDTGAGAGGATAAKR